MGLVRQLRLIFDLKAEVNRQGIMLWPPEEHEKKGSKGQKPRPDKRTIRRSTVGTVRCIMSIGSDENFNISAAAAGRSGASKIHSRSGEALQIQLGISAATDITFDTTNSFKAPPQKGFREKLIKKYPGRRYIICVDFLADSQKLIESIKESSSSHGLNADGENKVRQAFDVQRVISDAEKMVVQEEEPPNLVPISAAKSIAAAAAPSVDPTVRHFVEQLRSEESFLSREEDEQIVPTRSVASPVAASVDPTVQHLVDQLRSEDEQLTLPPPEPPAPQHDEILEDGVKEVLDQVRGSDGQEMQAAVLHLMENRNPPPPPPSLLSRFLTGLVSED